MITSKMNFEEIRKELLNDLQEVVEYSEKFDHKYKRAILKSKRFPLFFKALFYTSKQHNNWAILHEAKSRKDRKEGPGRGLRATFICINDIGRGLQAHMVSFVEGGAMICTYPPHFFSRYAERYGSTLHGKDLIVDYFKYNYDFSFDYKSNTDIDCKYEISASTKHGISLGLMFNDNNDTIFKTFITYEMMKGKQIEDFIKLKQFREEIHGKN